MEPDNVRDCIRKFLMVQIRIPICTAPRKWFYNVRTGLLREWVCRYRLYWRYEKTIFHTEPLADTQNGPPLFHPKESYGWRDESVLRTEGQRRPVRKGVRGEETAKGRIPYRPPVLIRRGRRKGGQRVRKPFSRVFEVCFLPCPDTGKHRVLGLFGRPPEHLLLLRREKIARQPPTCPAGQIPHPPRPGGYPPHRPPIFPHGRG